MNVWYHLSTILKRCLALQLAGLGTLCVALITTLIFANVSQAAPGVNQTISFQGRLSSPAGGIVADGYYNIQFKIYQDGAGTSAGNSGGTLKWTESYVNNSNNEGVQVKNGYFNVTLGSKTAFGSSIDWNQDTLWLSMNVAGTAAACTTFGSSPCLADGEMLPMKRLTAVPQALNSQMLGGKTADGFIQNSTSPQTGDFNITGIGVAGTFQATNVINAPSIDTASAGTLSIGTTNATSVTIGNNSATTNVSGKMNVTLNSSSTTSMPVSINQQGSGDAGISMSTVSSSTYSVGVDATDGKFKVGSSVAAGSTSNLGYTTVGATNESNNYQHIQANKYTASQTGTVMNMSVYVQAIDSFCPNVQLAVYADNGSGTAPAALLGSTAATAGANGWNTFQMTSTVNISSGTVYWLAVFTDCDHTLRYTTGIGTRAYRDSVSSAPSPFAAGGTTTGQVSLYATIDTHDGTTDSFGGSASIFELGATGQATFQNSTNSTTAFQVQNAAGTSALTVDTTNSSVLVAGALDTTAAATLTLGSTNATSVTIGKTGSNIATTVLGTAIFKPTTGNDSTTAFQLQRANGTKMFVADSTNQTITFGDPASANRTVISTSTGAITKYGTARNTKKITLAAEYTNSVLDAGTGSNNSGTMTSSIDLTNRMNYYKWTTSQVTNQSYDVVVQVPLPTDFDGWVSSNPLSITTRTSSTANGTITLEARDSTGAVQCDFVSVTPGSTDTWATNNSACTLNTGTYTAGDYVTLRIRMQSPNSGDVRVGNINLSYLSKH